MMGLNAHVLFNKQADHSTIDHRPSNIEQNLTPNNENSTTYHLPVHKRAVPLFRRQEQQPEQERIN